MEKSKKYRWLLLVAATLVLVVIFLLLSGILSDREGEKHKVGFILSGGATEDGWNGMHYRGMKSACETAEADLLIEEYVLEGSGQCGTAVRELVEAGCEMVVLSSYGYSEEVHELVREYPEVVFYGNSSEYHEENLTSYFVKMYQARYLAGIVAGSMTESNRIGYVAAMNNNEVNRGISAFTLGVRKANPEAVVTVIFTNTWDDESREKEAANKLIDNVGVDVITYHQNQTYVVEAAEMAGIYSIGYHESAQQFSDRYLTCVKCDWEQVYRELLQEFLKGKANSTENFWIGLETGAVGLAEFSDAVPKNVQKAVKKAEKELLDGKEVFSGVIYDSNGKLQCGENELISDERLLEQFDWFVEGVGFYEE
ncbi:MAG: BMP family ABC transporter substrate-binding protein [Lachnospiraceae bacterium]|nr:BMP family ABC transporter substrate-binding protein [Lachnospiraceae bacterium]